MGFLRKVVKKIGKGIKKVVKKIGKAFGKLGVVGQLGLMLFMPQFGLSDIWGRIGSWATKPGGNLLQKAVGHIYNGANAVGNVYRTVTEAIGNGFDRATNFIKGEGFVLSPERSSIFGRPKIEADIPVDLKEDVLEDAVDKVADINKPNILDKIVETKDNIVAKITDPNEISDAVTKGAVSGLSQRVSMGIAGDPPVQRYTTTNLDLASLGNYSQGSVMSQVDFMQGNNAYQSMGSTWGAGSSVAAPYLNKYTFGIG